MSQRVVKGDEIDKMVGVHMRDRHMGYLPWVDMMLKIANNPGTAV